MNFVFQKSSETALACGYFLFSVYLQRGALDNRPVEDQQEDQLQAHQQQAPSAHDQLGQAGRSAQALDQLGQAGAQHCDQWMMKPQSSGSTAPQDIEVCGPCRSQAGQAGQWMMKPQY